jgi:hypothetical protein
MNQRILVYGEGVTRKRKVQKGIWWMPKALIYYKITPGKLYTQEKKRNLYSFSSLFLTTLNLFLSYF